MNERIFRADHAAVSDIKMEDDEDDGDIFGINKRANKLQDWKHKN